MNPSSSEQEQQPVVATPTRTSPPPSSLFENSTDTLTFFADAQLDLEEAHDIADTPEAAKPQLDALFTKSSNHDHIHLPQLHECTTSSPTRHARKEETTTSRMMETSTHEKDDFSRITGGPLEVTTQRLVIQQRKPRWPRDIPWTLAFVATVPTTLVLTSSTSTRANPLSLHTFFFACALAMVLVPWMYRSRPGGEGDATRHTVVTLLSWAAPLSAIVLYACLGIVLLRRHHTWTAVLPWMALLRDVYAVRRWHQPGTGVSGYASRVGTFHAMSCMGLDMLSRSVRHRVRYVSIFLGVQILVTFWWRHALQRYPWVALVVGKWAAEVVTRGLTYLSSAAVMYWCAAQQQPVLQENMKAEQEDEEEDFDMPEAYRTVDASVYQSVTTSDDRGYIDDGEDLEQEILQDAMPTEQQQQPRHTVKSILWNGFSISFGSIAACGLLGGIAQFAWSQLRRLPRTRVTNFIREHVVHRYNDLAMTHVAMSYKGYVRSARDVAAIMETSGMDPILQDDITTHMCNSLSGAIASALVLVAPTRSVTDIFLSFVLCYTLIQTVMEPLRASVKAAYVAFAHNPQCLSQTYPLLFHRLSRMAEAR